MAIRRRNRQELSGPGGEIVGGDPGAVARVQRILQVGELRLCHQGQGNCLVVGFAETVAHLRDLAQIPASRISRMASRAN